MRLVFVLIAAGIAGAAVASRRFVREPRTTEAVIIAVISCIPGFLVAGRGSQEFQAWSGLLALAMSGSFWILAGISLFSQRWPSDSTLALSASATVWGLSLVFVVADLVCIRDSVVFGLVGVVPISIVLVVATFCISYLFLREPRDGSA